MVNLVYNQSSNCFKTKKGVHIVKKMCIHGQNKIYVCHQPISSLLFMKLKVLKHFQFFILLKTIAIDNWMNLNLTQAMEKELVAINITPHLFARIVIMLCLHCIVTIVLHYQFKE
jgi:hypothetical protein